MHARLGRLRIDPARVDRAMDLTRERIIPAFAAQPGALHGYWMVHRGSGHAMTVTCWEDQATLALGRAAMGEVRDAVMDAIGGHLVETGSYLLDGVSGLEAPMHGRAEWSCVTFVEGLARDGSRLPGELTRTSHQLHDDEEGFHSVCWFVDDRSGLGFTITSWEDEDALIAAEPTGRRARRRFEAAFGCHIDGREVVETLVAVGSGVVDVVDLTTATDAPVGAPTGR